MSLYFGTSSFFLHLGLLFQSLLVFLWHYRVVVFCACYVSCRTSGSTRKELCFYLDSFYMFMTNGVSTSIVMLKYVYGKHVHLNDLPCVCLFVFASEPPFPP